MLQWGLILKNLSGTVNVSYLFSSLHEHLFIFSEYELPVDNGGIVDLIDNVHFLVSWNYLLWEVFINTLEELNLL